ncbi:unnamed protein product [Microthlaspi erraticum]|uniref:Uncharacterized protein n=1 Tax=Microthlaspi erraticum TaxID=1685480 RepID=A0A6D2I7W3_9BRAS|nr:unnamed protein product [Microthlaspi erraticum]
MKWYIQGLVFGYLSVPQRTGRLGRGLEMVDGHQEHSTQLPLVTRSSLLSSSFFLKVCGFLGLGGALVARTVHRGSIYSGEAPGKAWDRIQIPDPRTGAPPGQLDRQLDRVEFPLFGLDRVRWSSWSVWPWKSSSFSACCLLLPLARKKRLCEALGQGASLEWGSEVNVLTPTTVVSSGLGRRSLEGPANGCVNLNWNLPSNSLCSMRRLVLQNLMSIQPGSVALYQLGSLQQHTR